MVTKEATELQGAIAGPWLFCHIPKTAGTSFRAGLEAVLTPEELLRDYGPKSEATSPELKEKLNALGNGEQWRFLCGHFPLDRYGERFSAARIATFVRRPLQQLVSHYEHHRRHMGFAGSLIDFAGRQGGAGVQTQMLRGVPVQLLGFVGVTEQMAESLDVFNAVSGLPPVPEVEANQNPDKSAAGYGVKLSDFPEALRSRILGDYWLYVQATRILGSRLAALKAGEGWTHGAFSTITPHWIEGVAFRVGGGRVPVELRRNGSLVAVLATGVPPNLPGCLGLSGGRQGFRFEFSQPLARGERIELRDADSGQWLDTQQCTQSGPQFAYRPPHELAAGGNVAVPA